MTATAPTQDRQLEGQRPFTIREVSERTGLSLDTLRWYEREGLIPSPPRGTDLRRVYPERLVEFILLVVALRRTGMPVADVRAFVQLADEGAASHTRRMMLLKTQRASIKDQQAQLDRDLGAVEHKIAHYQELIDAGLDCDGIPVSSDVAAAQRSTTRERTTS